MRIIRHILVGTLALLAPLTVAAEEAPRVLTQVPMLPLADKSHLDLDALFGTYWRDYYNTQDPKAFRQANIRAGRVDLDGDGVPELIALIDHPAWEADQGRPMVIATWTQKGWRPIGWAWGDEDTIFVTVETVKEWKTLDTGSQILRWSGRDYQRIERTGRMF